MSDPASSAPADIRKAWAARAEGWKRTTPEGATPGDRHNRRMIEAAGIAPGATVLDLASGTGEPAISIAVHIGAHGRVVATDAVREMLDGARRRATGLSLDQMSFVVADMSALPYADGVFDAVTCRFGLMFPPDPVAALRETRRVLVPGGRAAYMTHGPYEEATLYRIVRETALAFFRLEGSPTAGLRHRFAAPGTIAEAMRAAGFVDVADHAVEEVSEWPAAEKIWRRGLERRYSRHLAGLSAARRDELERRLEAAFAPYLDGDVYRLSTVERLGAGTAP